MLLLQIIIGVVGLSSIMFFGIMLLANRKLNQQIERLTLDLARLKRENRVISAGAIGVGQRIIDLEKFIHELSFRQEKKETPKPTQSSYLQATKLAKMGANLEDIVESCALSKAEAELVLVLQRKNDDKDDLPEVFIEEVR